MTDGDFGPTEYWLARTRLLIAAFAAALRERGDRLDSDLRVVADARSMDCYYDPDERVPIFRLCQLGLRPLSESGFGAFVRSSHCIARW